MDKLGGGVQAAFAPADSAALKTAVGTCAWNGTAFVCTGGCLGEIFAVDMNHSFVPMNGSCPNMTASNDATGNPYGPMEDWDVSQVTSFDSSTPNLYSLRACGSLTILGFFFFLVRVQHQLH